ncbi:nardilysin-like isoform X2 [Hylaeus volcanicus]|uniref:nardilysin-like isoform X2 n=1 Tax=Hylaeus volcanicus TaxID=313075 RepID=UPI0023B81D9E|nr:nardilysin-like isoform X2 [Hylaeus volcanicus]
MLQIHFRMTIRSSTTSAFYYWCKRDKGIRLHRRSISSLADKTYLTSVKKSPPVKKLKSDQGSSNLIKNLTTLAKHNLNNVSSTSVDKMQTENRPQEVPHVVTEKPRVDVTYLDTPVKSENDKKEYRVIKLKNGLTALLISDLHSSTCQDDDNEDKDEEDEETGSEDEHESDEDDEDDLDDQSDEEKSSRTSKRLQREEKMAACGLCVGVGSFSDPLEIPGLAHFLEHMVFMGSEKYPQENEMDAFIKKRGGSDNASTECEFTTFYFEVEEKHLLSALDRFAQFFIKPLMKKDAITREREAVESEFQMALPDDSYKKEQFFCSFARPNHPATKFSWGNLITLRDNVTDEKLYEELHKFRERHYSAHRMTLAIQARLPLDALEDYVTQCFTDVPNNGLPPDDFSKFKGADSFDTPRFRRIYKIKPVNDVCQVELTWSMRPMHDWYASKPHQYVSWIIGDEGNGSLISYLRKKMWCLDIVTGNNESGFEHSSMYALFTLSLILTEQGFKHLQEVLNATFSFLNLMHKKGPQKRIFDEIQQIENTSFRFADEVPPAEYVEELCENMHYYPPRDYITGNKLYFEYNPEAILACLNYLTPDNVNIIISDKKFNDEEFDKIEPWFQTKYTDTEIPQEWIECWRTIEPLPEFHLPLPNAFLTDDFTLIPIPPDVPKYPTKIYSDDITEVWYRPDPKFRLPECYMNFYIISPMAIYSPKSAALIDLFVKILKWLLVEELYPATTAQLNYEIYTSDKGIMLKVNGFNQKLPLLLTTIAKSIADCTTLVTKELYNVVKEQHMKNYYNTFLRPKKLVKDARLSLLLSTHWSAVDRHGAISGVEFDEFRDFMKYFTDHIYIQCLVQGNMTKEDVMKNVHDSVKTLKCGPLLPNTMPQIRVNQIPLGLHYCKIRNFNETDANSVVVNYYQSGIGSIKLSVIIELLIMIMEEPLFNQLRTQEQLCYDVFCLMSDASSILGYTITVFTQVDKYSTEHVDQRIEAFLRAFNEILKETTEKDFKSIKEALIKQKQCADIHLREELDRNWPEITTGDYMFDRIENELITIESIKIDQLREWMNAHTINGSNLRKLSVHVIGTPKSTDKENNKDVKLHTDKTNLDSKIEKPGNLKYSFIHIPITECNNDTCLVHYISNVEEYKHRLYSYPISHTTL